MRFWDKALKSSLAMLVLFSTLFLVAPNNKVDAKETNYEIYPTPHEMTYQEGNYIIRGQVNVVYEDKIDAATKKRMNEVLALKNKEVSTSNEKVDGKTNILVGTYNSGGYVDDYVKANYDVDGSLFNKFGAHFVASNNGEIVILGSDSDGAFYGITTLKHIFKQMDGSTIRNFEINDYADTNIRGFIEGYYGIPWSNQDRMSLMKFGGEFKMTSYVFAPKDDPYHKNLWRELYPEDELNAIKEMVQVGNDSKCRFVWTAHPFMGGFNASRVDDEIAALLNKFDQLYEAGVRQFGVLGDDVGSLDRDVVIKMMNRVSTWAKDKGDVYDSVFCPAGYNHSWQGNYSELNDYDAGFPDDIKIFWTGEAVCKPVEQSTLDHFKNYNLPAGSSERRSPLFWLNWPVNDINGSRLMMGKGSLLHTNINIDDLAGVVTNPMQEAEASKVAIFAVADYAWNVKDFDDDQSWVDSFKYIDLDASDELYTLAKHMSNPQPNGHGLVLAESEELQPLINEFKTKLTNGESIIETGNQLINEMDAIINATVGFHANSKNEKLKEELLPFTDSLRDLTTAIKEFTKAAIALEENNMVEAFNQYSDASAKLISSQNHIRKLISGTAMVSPGSTHLIPLANTLQEKLSEPINNYVAGGDREEPLVISASSNMNSWYGGTKIENIIDGNENSYAWNGAFEATGQYFQVDLSKPTTIYGVHILNGTTDKPKDTFGYAKLQYSTDGTTFTDLNKEVYGEYATEVDVANIEIENVVAVRYVCSQTTSENKWPAMREFVVATQPEQAEDFTKEVIFTPDGWSAGNVSNIIDGNRETNVHFNVRQSGYPDATNSMLPGDYIGVKLSKPITLGVIDILQGRNDDDGDYMKNAQLQYSVDGAEWVDVGDVITNTRNIVVDLSKQNITAQYVRLVNTQKQNTWYGIREFDVAAKIYHNGKVFTNVSEYSGLTADYFDDSANITPVDKISLAKGEYIGLKLDRIHEISNIVSDLTNTDLTIQISKNNHEWKTVIPGSVNDDARYLRIINLEDNEIEFDLNEFVVNTSEINEKTVVSTNFAINQPLNVFDGDWTTATQYQGSQNAGKYFVYDLGQEINLNTFKVVCTDGEWDYPRHGKFLVSTDGENWDEIMTLGNQDEANPGEADNTDEIGSVLPDHEISYNTKKVEGLNIPARYLKFEITKTKVGADKWVRFQELEINNGEYVPTVNDPSFTSNAQETRNGLFSYMTDGDLATMFIPDSENGYVNYSLSDKNAVNTIKIIQNADVISNATVKARVLDDTESEKWIELGTLSQTINEFVLAQDTILLDVKIEWKNVIPNITELLTYKSDVTELDTSALEALINDKEDTAAWTTMAAKLYSTAYQAGAAVLESEYASQTTIDNAALAINNAITNKVLKGDISKLEAVLKQAVTDQENYTAASWLGYGKAINAVTKAIENAENTSVDDVNTLIDNVNAAFNSLVFNPSNQENAVITIEGENDFVASITDPANIYTVNSWQAYNEAKETVERLITDNQTTPVHPDLFAEALKTLADSKDGLVTLENLPALIAEFDAISNPDIYTADTFTAYQDAINHGRSLLVDGNRVTIAAGIKAIVEAKGNLKFALSNDITELLETLKLVDGQLYTVASYQNLVAVIAEIEAVDLDKATREELAGYIEKLNTAKANLVDVTGLKNMLEAANKINQELYTTSTYAKLSDAIVLANQRLENGTLENISDSIAALDQAIKGLEVRANEQDVKDYVNSIELVDLSKYTESSSKAYQAAYNVLKAMLEDLTNVSAKDFIAAKNDFENASAKLVAKEAVTLPSATPVKPVNSKVAKTGDDLDITAYVVGLGIVAIAGVYFFVKHRKYD